MNNFNLENFNKLKIKYNKLKNKYDKLRNNKNNHIYKKYFQILNIEELKQQMKNRNMNYKYIAESINFSFQYVNSMLSGRDNANNHLRDFLYVNGFNVKYHIKQKGKIL